MVVLGALRCFSNGSQERGGGMVGGAKVCSVAWQRDSVFQQQQQQHSLRAEGECGETLPVVELKPFTKKVWSREKSLPNFYDKPSSRCDDSGSESSRHTPRPQAQGSGPGVARYIQELNEQGKAAEGRHGSDLALRSRSQMHPKARFQFQGCDVSQHQQDLIPSFITRTGRTRTTLGEDGVLGTYVPATLDVSASEVERWASAPGLGRETSSLLAAYTRNSRLLHEPGVVLLGGKLPVTNLGRRPLLYLQPYAGFKPRLQEWTSFRRSDKSPTSSVSGGSHSPRPRYAASLPLASRDSEAATSTNGRLLQSGRPYQGVSRAEGRRLRPLKAEQGSPHKLHSSLGAAHESLLVLGRTGEPTVLERVLSRDQELRLERCRRERSFAAGGESSLQSTAHYVAYDSQPTRGEMTLLKARQANRAQEGRPKTLSRRTMSQGGLQMRPQRSQSRILLASTQLKEHSSNSPGFHLPDCGIASSSGDNYDNATPSSSHVPASRLGTLGEASIPEYPVEQETGLPMSPTQGWTSTDSALCRQHDEDGAGRDPVSSAGRTTSPPLLTPRDAHSSHGSRVSYSQDTDTEMHLHSTVADESTASPFGETFLETVAVNSVDVLEERHKENVEHDSPVQSDENWPEVLASASPVPAKATVSSGDAFPGAKTFLTAASAGGEETKPQSVL